MPAHGGQFSRAFQSLPEPSRAGQCLDITSPVYGASRAFQSLPQYKAIFCPCKKAIKKIIVTDKKELQKDYKRISNKKNKKNEFCA
jgi:hypothetical protein